MVKSFLSNKQINRNSLQERYKNYYKDSKIKGDIFELLDLLYNSKNDDPFSLLIEGAPGMGKSYICKEIAYQWAVGNFSKPNMLFYLCLHDKKANTICTLKKFLEFVYPGGGPKILAKYLSDNKGMKVMVIIDGYDKFSVELKNKNSLEFINKLIQRTIPDLQKCDMIITSSRTVSRIDFKECTRIELIGFNEDFKQQYIQSAFDKDGKGMKDLMEYLSVHPTLNSLCYIPLYLAIVVFQFKKSRSMYNVALPSCRTEAINRLVCIMIMQVNIPDKNIADLFNELSKEKRVILAELSKIAYCVMKQNMVVFTIKKLEGMFPCISKMQNILMYGFGFLNGLDHFEPSGIDSVYFSFLHYSLQDYLAAFYVSIMPEDKQKQVWNDTCWKKMYLNCWAYYCKLKIPFNALKSSLPKKPGTSDLSCTILNSKVKCLYLVYCLMELPIDDIYQQVKSMVIKDNSNLDLGSCHLTKENLDIFALFLSRFPLSQWNSITLSSCLIDDNKCEALLCALTDLQRNLPKINVLDVAHNQILHADDILNISAVLNVSVLNLSFNKIEDEKITNALISPTHVLSSKLPHCNLWLISSNQTCFVYAVKQEDILKKFWSNCTFSKFYIIRSLLNNTAGQNLLKSLKLQSCLHSIFLFDTKISDTDARELVSFLATETHTNCVSIFEKSLSEQIAFDMYTNITNYRRISNVLLISNEAIRANSATHQQILQALVYNPSISYVQLNHCYLTHEIMKKIALILNESFIDWRLLDLSGCELDDSALTALCNILENSVKINMIKLVGNQLSSASLLAILAETINISDNQFSNHLQIAMTISQNLVKQSSLALTTDSDFIKFCFNLNLNAVRCDNLNQLFISNCTISGLLIQTTESNISLSFLHLSNITYNGEPFYKSTEFLNNCKIAISICEDHLPNDVVSNLTRIFDSDGSISRIVSTNDVIMAHNCSYNVLKWHLTQVDSVKVLNLAYIRNCLLQDEPSDSNIIKEYFHGKYRVNDLVLCNNILNHKKIIEIVTEPKFLNKIFISELQTKLVSTYIAKQLPSSCSTMIVGKTMVAGNWGTSDQISRAVNLMSSSIVVLLLKNCSFTVEQCRAFCAVIATCKNLEVFTFYDCGISDVWTEELVKALKETHKLTSLYVSNSMVYFRSSESLASALATVIQNNTYLKTLGINFNNLKSSACCLILQAISQITSLKQFEFHNGQLNTEEGIGKLKNALASNTLLEIIDLGDNNLQTTGMIKIAECLQTVHHLKVLKLNGNLISEEAADDIAKIITSNKGLEKLLFL